MVTVQCAQRVMVSRAAGISTGKHTSVNIFVGCWSYRDFSEKVNRRPSSCSCLHVHSATASVQELRPSTLRSELAYRALRVLDSSPFAGSGSLSKNFFSWQRGFAATWEQRTFEFVTELRFKQA